MGTFTVPLEVADPLGRNYETIDALVDSGATYTVLPTSVLERLGVVPHGARRFVLADGTRIERGFGRTWMRLDGREDLSPVVFWDEGAQPLLGAVTLEISPKSSMSPPDLAKPRSWRYGSLHWLKARNCRGGWSISWIGGQWSIKLLATQSG